MLKLFPAYINGENIFGLTSPVVCRILESVRTLSCCVKPFRIKRDEWALALRKNCQVFWCPDVVLTWKWPWNFYAVVIFRCFFFAAAQHRTLRLVQVQIRAFPPAGAPSGDQPDRLRPHRAPHKTEQEEVSMWLVVRNPDSRPPSGQQVIYWVLLLLVESTLGHSLNALVFKKCSDVKKKVGSVEELSFMKCWHKTDTVILF